MGIFLPSSPVALQPVHPPVAVFPAFISQGPVTLVLREQIFSLSGDDFSVKDAATGKTVVRCKGKVVSFRDRKNVTDASGNLLFSMRDKLIAFMSTFVAEDARGHELFRVKRNIALGTKMTATFRNANTGENAELSMRGDMFGLGTTIVLNGNIPVAQISRKLLHMREWIADKQTYYVTVAPGVDLALIAALCIAFDEVKNEKKE
ncbi:uncharacterized protein CcaverHIS019_0700630 [Cutaneotrichosporon cavernicola]|uniref:DUF567-domain-containing protein n=1 Tax=Cutaneotrichosporon cavernicola TaxID=279322 RepID=A0AA48L976_9TREE|nr:uncharacterized protein CcaverHIS019_0700630 [Cutaneotrichosporon cavernicola]BEI94491.1 hypothetical protein CcaverHIS019_0700630 [Cutaneotrichosporon cavernicola]BEJ02267.1 hypothetical protein CcaverHIS631_0700620 [Cutaneotrichosporon cavernicola]BEJ10026.1 hypothetical protein CcaverHIS641_0700610 [Cutaneotrichosporon cavernicola]